MRRWRLSQRLLLLRRTATMRSPPGGRRPRPRRRSALNGRGGRCANGACDESRTSPTPGCRTRCTPLRRRGRRPTSPARFPSRRGGARSAGTARRCRGAMFGVRPTSAPGRPSAGFGRNAPPWCPRLRPHDGNRATPRPRPQRRPAASTGIWCRCSRGRPTRCGRASRGWSTVRARPARSPSWPSTTAATGSARSRWRWAPARRSTSTPATWRTATPARGCPAASARRPRATGAWSSSRRWTSRRAPTCAPGTASSPPCTTSRPSPAARTGCRSSTPAATTGRRACCAW